MLLQLSHFPPSFPSTLCTPSYLHSPPSCPWVIYMFFGFYISYTILNLPLSILYLPFMLLILCTFSPSLPTQSPTDNPPCDLHFCGFCSCSSCLLSLFLFLFLLLFQLLITVSLFSFYCSYFLPSFSYIIPFNISYNKGLVMMNFNLTLYGKHFICPSILNDSIAE